MQIPPFNIILAQLSRSHYSFNVSHLPAVEFEECKDNSREYVTSDNIGHWLTSQFSKIRFG